MKVQKRMILASIVIVLISIFACILGLENKSIRELEEGKNICQINGIKTVRVYRAAILADKGNAYLINDETSEKVMSRAFINKLLKKDINNVVVLSNKQIYHNDGAKYQNIIKDICQIYSESEEHINEDSMKRLANIVHGEEFWENLPEEYKDTSSIQMILKAEPFLITTMPEELKTEEVFTKETIYKILDSDLGGLIMGHIPEEKLTSENIPMELAKRMIVDRGAFCIILWLPEDMKTEELITSEFLQALAEKAPHYLPHVPEKFVLNGNFIHSDIVSEAILKWAEVNPEELQYFPKESFSEDLKENIHTINPDALNYIEG